MDHTTHTNHSHQHGAGCGHTEVAHEDHVDYLHDGHLHHQHGDHYDEHSIAVNSANLAGCAGADCDCAHNADCGHEAVPHGDHVDYVHNGRLHHPHADHVDDHGALATV